MKKTLGVKTVVFPTPVFVVGTYNEDDTPNIMTVAWGGICCSDPACIAISVREATHTYGNLLRRDAFTVSIPSTHHLKEADYAGIASGRTINKFEKLGLTAVPSDVVDAPYVGEFPLVLECKVYRTVDLGLHTQFVGAICDLKVEGDAVDDDGNIDMAQLNLFMFDPANRDYYAVGERVGKAFSAGRSLDM